MARRGLLGSVALALLACSSPERERAPVDVRSHDAGSHEPEAPGDDAGAPPPAPLTPTFVCSDDGWCWDSPRVQGNTLHDVLVLAADEAWAVGELGTVLRFDGERWQREAVPTREHLRSVWSDGDELWIVGDGSTVLRRSGAEWQALEIPALPAGRALRAVFGHGGELWIAGGEGTLLERRAGAWTAVTLDGAPPAYNALYADGDEAWAVGDAGVVVRYAAGAWTRVSAATSADLLRVHGRNGETWLSGENGVVRRFDGEAWRAPSAEGDAPSGALHALWVGPNDLVYTANAAGEVFVYDGDAPCAESDAGVPDAPCPRWRLRPSGSSLALRALSGRGAFSTAVGDNGTIVSWSGEVRSLWSKGSRDNHLDVAGHGDRVWVGGDRLLLRSQEGWNDIERDGERAIYALAAHADGALFIAGTAGTTRRYADEEWQRLDVRADAWLRGLWSDERGTWLVGSRGGAWGLLNGSLWTPLETPTDNDLLGVWASAEGHAWAVGESGTILRHDGIGWAQIPSGPSGGVTADLRAVWGSGPDDVWVVGSGGNVLRFDGTRFESTLEPAAFSLNDLWGRAANEIWAVGTGGTILRFDGNVWHHETSGTAHALNGIWGSPERLWVVGENGTILFKELD